MPRLGLQWLQSAASVPVQSSSDRVRISWNAAETSSQCCLCNLSSAPLPGVSPTGILKILGSNPSWILDFFPWIGFISRSISKKYLHIVAYVQCSPPLLPSIARLLYPSLPLPFLPSSSSSCPSLLSLLHPPPSLSPPPPFPLFSLPSFFSSPPALSLPPHRQKCSYEDQLSTMQQRSEEERDTIKQHHHTIVMVMIIGSC